MHFATGISRMHYLKPGYIIYLTVLHPAGTACVHSSPDHSLFCRSGSDLQNYTPYLVIVFSKSNKKRAAEKYLNHSCSILQFYNYNSAYAQLCSGIHAMEDFLSSLSTNTNPEIKNKKIVSLPSVPPSFFCSFSSAAVRSARKKILALLSE